MSHATNILRTSIHAFIHGYHSFVPVASLFVLPLSASILISQSVITSSPSTIQFISSRFNSLFDAAHFPIFSLLNLMLSQTIFSTVFTLPFTFTFLLLAKASIIHILKKPPPPFSSLLVNLYPSLLLTQLCNSFIILSANAGIFVLFFLILNASEFLGLNIYYASTLISLVCAVAYSVVLANTVVICNLAIVVSAVEKCSGVISVLKACVLIKSRVATALSIAFPVNLALAAVEALFQYRVMRMYHSSDKFNMSIVWEAFTVAYMHSVIVVVEIIASFLLYKSCCRLSCRENWEGEFEYEQGEIEPEDKGQV